MKLNQVRQMAKKHGIISVGKTKAYLIREIQVKEGNFDCFGKAVAFCDQVRCKYLRYCVQP